MAHMSFSLHSFSGGYLGDYIEEIILLEVTKGDTRSLD